MPFDSDTKSRMFTRCGRLCCLCLRQCGTNIEAAHIIDEATGGSNEEDNGIPLCFDCHQEVGAYNDKHPRGNKFGPKELRGRRDRVYQLVESGMIYSPTPAKVRNPGVMDRSAKKKRQAPNRKSKLGQMKLQSSNYCIVGPTVAQVITAIDNLDHRIWDEAYVILIDGSFKNAFVQACREQTQLYRAEYRDGNSQRQFRSSNVMSLETTKLFFLAYLRQDDSFKHAIAWDDVTAQVTRLH